MDRSELGILLRTLIDSMPDYIFVKDADSRFVTTNAAHLRTLRAEKVEDVIGKTDFDFFPSELAQQYFADEQEVIRTKSPLLNREETATDENGQTHWLLTTKVPLTDENGTVTGVVGISRDISKRKRAELELQDALAEKDRAFRELNHRVKNNLNLVVSLIRLKANDLGETVDLTDLERHVSALANVHQRLQHTASVSQVSLAPYLGELVEDIFQGAYTLDYQTSIENVQLPTGIAQTLGLIINEIATNVLKHARGCDDPVQFRLAGRADRESGKYHLTASNTGCRFPEDVTLDNPHTLGLRLLRAFVDQLRGTIRLEREPDTTIVISIPI